MQWPEQRERLLRERREHQNENRVVANRGPDIACMQDFEDDWPRESELAGTEKEPDNWESEQVEGKMKAVRNGGDYTMRYISN